MKMFSVVGLTLDEVSTGSLPHVHLAKTLDNRKTKSNFRFAEIILVYTTVDTDTQGSAARTKYRQQGQFLVFLYFNDAAVTACKEIGIPIRVLDRIDESDLPVRRATVLERPYLAPISK
jgi:acid phosphatase class B